jgi:hypothetical protein
MPHSSKKYSGILLPLIKLTGLGLCGYAAFFHGSEIFDYWQEAAHRYFPPTKHVGEVPSAHLPDNNLTKAVEAARDEILSSDNASRDVQMPAQEIQAQAKPRFADLPPLPEPTREQLVKGYENVKAGQKGGGKALLPLIEEAARLAGLRVKAYLTLISSESSFSTKNNKDTGAANVSQNVLDSMKDNTARYGKVCQADINRHNPRSGALLKYLTRFVYFSDGDRGLFVCDEKAHRAQCENEILKKYLLPEEPAKATAQQRKRYEKKRYEVLENRKKALDKYAKVHETLEQKIIRLHKDPYVGLLFSAKDLAVKLEKLKDLIGQKNPNGRAAQLMEKFDDGFLYKLIHNGGFAFAIRTALADYDKPVLDVLMEQDAKENPSFSREKLRERAEITMSRNDWPRGVSAGGLIDKMFVQFVCEQYGIGVRGNLEEEKKLYREAIDIKNARLGIKTKPDRQAGATRQAALEMLRPDARNTARVNLPSVKGPNPNVLQTDGSSAKAGTKELTKKHKAAEERQVARADTVKGKPSLYPVQRLSFK